MAEYQLVPTQPGAGETVLRRADGAHIPDDPANRDWQTYLSWLDEGNVPDPPDPPPEPLPPEPDANVRLNAGVVATVNCFNDTPIPEGLDASSGLEARVDRLEATMEAMLEGQMSHLDPSPRLERH
jgi:hypothetical protein